MELVRNQKPTLQQANNSRVNSAKLRCYRHVEQQPRIRTSCFADFAHRRWWRFGEDDVAIARVIKRQLLKVWGSWSGWELFDSMKKHTASGHRVWFGWCVTWRINLPVCTAFLINFGISQTIKAVKQTACGSLQQLQGNNRWRERRRNLQSTSAGCDWYRETDNSQFNPRPTV